MGFTTESQRQMPVSAAARGDSAAVSAGSTSAKILQLKYVTCRLVQKQAICNFALIEQDKGMANAGAEQF